MKKILSVLLVACLLITSCLMFTSCASKVSVKDVEKNTYETLNTAVDQFTTNFFGDDAGIDATVEKAMKNGSISFTFDSEDVLSGSGLKSVKGTIFTDEANKKSVMDLSVQTDSDTIDARLFVNKDGILISSNDFLNGAAYGIYPQKLVDNFNGSSLAQMMGISAEDAKEMVALFEEFAKSYKDAYEKAEQLAKDNTDKITEILKQKVESEKIEIEDKKIDCVKIVYTIDNKTIEDLFDFVLDEAKAMLEGVEGFNATDVDAQFKEAIDQLNKNADIDIEAVLYLDKKTGSLAKAVLDGSIEAEGQKLQIDGEMVFGEKNITIEGDLKLDGEKLGGFEAEIEKTTKGDDITYDMDFSVSSGNVTVDVFTATYEYNKSSGDFKLSVALAKELTDSDEKMKLDLTGNITKNENYASIAFDKLSFAGDTIDIGFKIEYDVAATIPAEPSNVKDVLDLTQADVEKIMEDFTNSKLGKMIADMMGSYEDNYNDPYYDYNYGTQDETPVYDWEY